MPSSKHRNRPAELQRRVTTRATQAVLQAVLSALLLAAASMHAAMPPVPVPDANPLTEDKRILGKILFWDEQLSSDNTVACGTCHRPADGGADPRAGVHPGTDPGTIDDVHGSPGIAPLDERGLAREHPVFGASRQVTPRNSQSIYGALWADAVFWDGRASGRFVDPSSGQVLIEHGGALESQALMAISSDREMSKRGQRWPELGAKLARAAPLALASDWPDDVARRLADGDGYPALFSAAFGDRAITPARIAFALASYERTLVPDQTPWDRYVAGDESALDRTQRYGWQAMQDFRCVKCHEPPLFTNNDFSNIGLRRAEYDAARQNVTADPEDAGEVKVPSLRNVGLRKRFMHTGQFDSLGAAIGFYRTGPATPERDEFPGGGIYTFNMGGLTEADIRSFLADALTDPRVRDEQFPFDRPTLRSERHADDTTPPGAPLAARAVVDGAVVTLHWRAPGDDTGVVDYVVSREDGARDYTTRNFFEDNAARGATYRILARDAAGNESAPAMLTVELPVQN